MLGKYTAEHVNIDCWALRGYPLAPQRVKVVKVEPSNSHTDAFVLLDDGSRMQRALVYVTKPRRVKVTDEYGEITNWQGKQL